MALSASSLTVGESRTEVVLDNISRTQIVMYAGASGDYNPLHTDDLHTREAAGYPGVFAHGMLTMGMTGRALTDWVGDGRLTRYGVRFSRQVWPGDTLTVSVRVDAIRADGDLRFADFSFTTRNQNDEDVIVGTATARLDHDPGGL